MFKQVILILALVCLAQADFVPRNLTDDVEEAMTTTQLLITETQVLEQEENNMYLIIREDVFVILQGVLDKFRNFGVPQETLNLLLSNMSFAHEKIQLIIYDQIVRVAELRDLLQLIFNDLSSNWNNLNNDLEVLVPAQSTFNEQFINATINVDIQMQIIENMFNDVKSTLTAEQAAEIDVDMASAQALIDTQFVLVKSSKIELDQGITLLIAQLVNITDQLPPSDEEPLELY